MKTYICMTLLSIWIVLLHSCAVPSDEEDEELLSGDDTATASLPWEGETNKFIINSQEGIRLNETQGYTGTAYATFPSSNIIDTRWEFGVRLTFNPSANNYARFYLTSSNPNLCGILNGYFIQIGGAKDNVGLYRQDGLQPHLLISGRELMKGFNAPRLYIKVECDHNGNWSLWTRLEGENDYVQETQISENLYTEALLTYSCCCGIFCKYTQTRSKGIAFHHIRISHQVSPSLPTVPTEPTPPEEVFSDAKGSILFNEIMYDCTPDGAEYIELYNPSSYYVIFPSLRLVRYIDVHPSGTQTEADIVLTQANGNQQIGISPHGYLCLTRSVNKLYQRHHLTTDNILEIPNLPKLPNKGSHLALITNESTPQLIDKCSYFEWMHRTDGSRHQGISLEKGLPSLPSSTYSNWHSSISTTGGSPGQVNTIETEKSK